MGDHPDADAEEVEDRAHPLRVAPGEVVVDGDDVDAAAGHRVEDGGQRRDEGLALAGPHLGDLALVEDGAAHQLDVEVAHPERPLHRLAGHREDLGQDVVERLLEPLVLALAAVLLQLAAALEVGVVELVVGRLVGLGGLEDLGAELGELRRGSPRRRGPRTRLRGRSSRRPAVGGVGSRGRSSRRIGSGSAWPVKYRGGRARAPRRPVRAVSGQAPEARCRSRRRAIAKVTSPRPSQNRTERNREVGFISGFLRSGRRAAARGPCPSAATGAGCASPGRRPVTRFEAALAVGSVELEGHRSPAWADAGERVS